MPPRKKKPVKTAQAIEILPPEPESSSLKPEDSLESSWESEALSLDEKHSDPLTAVDGELEAFDTQGQISVPALVDYKDVALVDPVVRYIQEIRKYPLLSREEEAELAKRYYETKDPEAASRLITSNLRFVVKIALEYSRFGARLIDLISEGNLGLVRALKEYNPYKGVRLITYAVWWIRGYIQEYLMKQFSLVKIGTTQDQKKLFYKLQKNKEVLQNLSEQQNFEEVGQQWNVDPETLKLMTERLSSRDVSLSRSIDEEGDASFMDLQKAQVESPEEALAKAEELDWLKKKIEDIRPSLTEKELLILEERLLADEPLTLQEIADRYGITREAVRQTETRLLSKMRQWLEGAGGKVDVKS